MAPSASPSGKVPNRMNSEPWILPDRSACAGGILRRGQEKGEALNGD